ncbi:hypothetical protein KKC94_00920 [Patescibacteria group bacterium]|nr:hypothetical protein [Patescibacteria group bacterium]
MKKIIIFLVTVISFTACKTSDEWTAFYYPVNQETGVTNILEKSGFNSVDQCRDWVIDKAGSNTYYSYECGKNCKMNTQFGMMMGCEEWIK